MCVGVKQYVSFPHACSIFHACVCDRTILTLASDVAAVIARPKVNRESVRVCMRGVKCVHV
jgi:hypothetical protein